ncbi:hypothetical protein [Myxococcus sp. RHSTA-1-4]|uniref:hypothetical protein n=1 Tax=Myxococcus sp. RHSTA-1-4 TaxID=2874601 RepID=UPI001CC1B073|nr:hypothetical protein [Myxococcus sp. RHSTA-1-4]MBZ4421646.1 hypothetical protein [Myxococcus sp. RHSTA-1-4]
MKLRLLIGICCQSLLIGCSWIGFYKHDKAERAPPDVAEKVDFPSSYEEGIHLDGPMMAALEVAMKELLPPGVKAQSDDERLARCMVRRDTYDTTILKKSEDLYFVSFIPNFERCGLSDVLIMDAGAVYAIDGRGRILSEF